MNAPGGPKPLAAMEFVDLKAQYRRLKPAIDARIACVLEHGQYIMGPEVAELEERLSRHVGAQCVAVASGTDALLVAMMALGIGAGDEVITTPFTFIATGEMIALLGAKPVFVDVEADTYNIDPALIEPAVTPRTRAIMPVNLYGQCADFDAINAIAARHGLPVIEDAAQSFGATYRGRASCALSTIGCTSFFPSKPLGCYGDGGACFTADAALAKAMREIRVHGQDRRYHHARLGVNGRIDTLQAAVLLAKLDGFSQELEARARVAARYSDGMRSEPRIQIPALRADCTSAYAQYTIGVAARNAVAARLKDMGIPTAIHYPVPLHLQPLFDRLGAGRGAFPVAEAAAERVLSLPMHPFLEEAAQDRVIAAVRRVTSASA
jgi:UDP-2-acetamido-2-deoxy-ribo-hexuluronate aminotransferase